MLILDEIVTRRTASQLASERPATWQIRPGWTAVPRDYDVLASELGAEEPRVKAVRIAEVEARELEPPWPGVIWVGKPTLLVGDPGLSKSTLACDVVARVTRHLEWPCFGGLTIHGDVLMLAAEDAHTLRPRVEAAGADLGRVHPIESIITGRGGTARSDSWPSLVEHITALTDWLKGRPGVRRPHELRIS